MKTSVFDPAVEYVLKNEGGYVCDPDDPGGATNFGITISTLSHWRGEQATAADVQKLSREQASLIYFEYYWTPLGCDRILSAPIATAMLDVAVLFGVGTSILYAQKALAGFDLVIDGFMGMKTVSALNTIDAKTFLTGFVVHLKKRIESITSQTPKLQKFKNGWSERVDHLLTLA